MKIGTQWRSFCFFLSTGFLLVLRNHGDLSHRGPLLILVIWIALALLSGIWLRSAITANDWIDAAILVALHSVYMLSLIFKGNSTYVQRRTFASDVSLIYSIEIVIFDNI